MPSAAILARVQLSESQRKHLRRLGHGLRPVVIVGVSGASAAVIAEIEQALEHHELIKLRIRADDRNVRDALLEQLVTQSRATLVQRIGHVALIYRPAEKPKILLPTPSH